MHQLWIKDGWRSSAASLPPRRIEDPATLELVGEVTDAGADDVRAARPERKAFWFPYKNRAGEIPE